MRMDAGIVTPLKIQVKQNPRGTAESGCISPAIATPACQEVLRMQAKAQLCDEACADSLNVRRALSELAGLQRLERVSRMAALHDR